MEWSDEREIWEMRCVSGCDGRYAIEGSVLESPLALAASGNAVDSVGCKVASSSPSAAAVVAEDWGGKPSAMVDDRGGASHARR